MNYRKNKNGKIIIIIILALTLTATVGYAVLTTVLKNNIVATIAPVKWQVYMENPSIYKDTTANSETNTVSLSNAVDSCVEYDENDSTICLKSEILDATVKFDRVERYVLIKFDTTNGGDMPAIIAENGVEVEGLGEFVTYTLKYNNSDQGIDVKPGDFFPAGKSKAMYLKLEYFVSDNVTDEDLPTVETSFNIKIRIKFIRGSKDNLVDNSLSSKVINKSLTGRSREINDYTAAMPSTTDSKLYLLESTEDEQYPIYFWRGTRASTNNNFIFASKCWLGIRTTDTGGIKMIYNGTPVDGKCTTITGEDTVIGSGFYNSVTGNSKYKDGSVNSDIKVALESWYESNILEYQDYLEDTVFCNDQGSFYSSRIDSEPSLVCSEGDSYTVSENYGNGLLNYPIGLISADEAMFNGMSPNASTQSFLHNASYFWTMTQGYESKYIYRVSSDGALLNNSQVVKETRGYRPVISLNAGDTVTGTGTQEDPFVVVTE